MIDPPSELGTNPRIDPGADLLPEGLEDRLPQSAAAATRINREEKEKGKTTRQTVQSLQRYSGQQSGPCMLYTC